MQWMGFYFWHFWGTITDVDNFLHGKDVLVLLIWALKQNE